MNVKTPDYQRLVIHLKFFLQRMYAAAPSPLSLKMENYDYVLLKHLQQDYARAYHCMERSAPKRWVYCKHHFKGS